MLSREDWEAQSPNLLDARRIPIENRFGDEEIPKAGRIAGHLGNPG